MSSKGWLCVVAASVVACTQGSATVPDAFGDTDVVDSIPAADLDQDGYGADVDCDDANPLVHPGLPEICNGADDDCDQLVDEAAAPIAGVAALYEDADRDGYGQEASARWFCTAPASGWVDVGGDCDDASADRRPDAIEVCNGIDDDCDGATDDEDISLVAAGTPGAVQIYEDADGDTFIGAHARWYCADHGLPVGVAGNDCLDTDPNTFPGAAQAESASSCRTDADDDGYGDDQPESGVTAGRDCDDGDPAVSPAVAEVYYDGTDADCDGRSDWDADHDGHDATTAPGGAGDDCDDTKASVYTGAADPPLDGIDQDCDGVDDPCVPGQYEACPVTSCSAAYLAGARVSGLTWIRPLSRTYQVRCEQTIGGGGWTLVAVVAQDGVAHWSYYYAGNLYDASISPFGSAANLAADMRSRAISELPMRRLMFQHAIAGAPQNLWAGYYVSASATTFTSWVWSASGQTLSGKCYGTQGGIVMDQGTLVATGTLCSTQLYMSPRDQDGGTTCTCTSCDGDAFGPAWSDNNGGGCELDDPGYSSGLGPSSYGSNAEYSALGFVDATGHLSSSGVNSLLIYVKE